MAARKTPSAGGKPDKIFRDALMLAVKREIVGSDGKKTSKINAIAAKVVDKAVEGHDAAYQLVRDTLDGKPVQSIGLGQANDLEPIQAAVRPAISRAEWLKLHGN